MTWRLKPQSQRQQSRGRAPDPSHFGSRDATLCVLVFQSLGRPICKLRGWQVAPEAPPPAVPDLLRHRDCSPEAFGPGQRMPMTQKSLTTRGCGPPCGPRTQPASCLPCPSHSYLLLLPTRPPPSLALCTLGSGRPVSRVIDSSASDFSYLAASLPALPPNPPRCIPCPALRLLTLKVSPLRHLCQRTGQTLWCFPALWKVASRPLVYMHWPSSPAPGTPLPASLPVLARRERKSQHHGAPAHSSSPTPRCRKPPPPVPPPAPIPDAHVSELLS